MDIAIDRGARQPVALQIRRQMRSLIHAGVWPAGSRLPATRLLSRQLGVSRNTVDEAYRTLAEDGLVSVRPGKGAFVEAGAARRQAETPSLLDWQDRIAPPMRNFVAYRTGVGAVAQGGRDVISFTSLAPDHHTFAAEAFRKCINDVLVNQGPVLLNYGYIRGYEPLRAYLREYLAAKGIDGCGNELLVVNGFRQGLELVLGVLCSPGDTVACELPTYNGALGAFTARGLQIAGVPMDGQGMDPQALEQVLAQRSPKLLYVVPTYQNPTGRSMSLARRRQVLALAARYGVPVVEDGFCEELRYAGEVYAPLKALDNAGLVIYVGSFSKILFPGLRVGWVLAPEPVAYYLYHAKYNADIHTGVLSQAALWAFCEQGHLERQLRYARKAYGQRMQALESALSCHMAGLASWQAGQGGFSTWLTFPQGTDTRAALPRARALGVAYAPGDSFYPDGRGRNCLRLGFSRLTPETIDEGVQRLKAVFSGEGGAT